jgi:hypothetical protein
VTIASLAKAAKPSPKIFEIALEKHAVDSDEAMHVVTVSGMMWRVRRRPG